MNAFLLPARKERYLQFLKSATNRNKFRVELAHFKALNPRFVVHIPPGQQDHSAILELLAAKGAGARCRVISENRESDGQELDLGTTLGVTLGGGMGTLISCIPGKLAYFEDEDVRYIPER